ncbi:DNA-directed DNA polymerase alpha subunit pol12 [Entomophthora muscae]|uniref:DNA-directed DNA polymerase alpha subunit pol12 n=2 Tax=Entomophthora muscae TaxID=34485 RepID=A0ACC2T8I9_9FUNG|nr:DNA-directed DNA polymerase alpha subunit pol12 [Entomophthora muscae]
MTFQVNDEIVRDFKIEGSQDDLVNQLAALAGQFSLRAKELAAKWQLYAISHKRAVIGNGGPSLEDLGGFQESLQNPAPSTPKKPASFASTPSRNNKRPPGSGKTFDLAKLEQELENTKLLPLTPKGTRIEVKIEKWENSGQVISTLHPSLPQSTQEPDSLANLSILTRYEENSRYMTLNLSDAAEILDSWIEERSIPLLKEFDFIKAEESIVMDDEEKPQEIQIQDPSQPHQAPAVFVGRICCSVEDNANNHLTGGVMLEPARSVGSTAARVPLDLSGIPSYSIFPGQIVGVEGINPTGNELRVSKLIQGSLPVPGPNVLTVSTKMVLACGPFTKSSNLKFEPLAALLHAIDHPHTLILIGPFLSEDHPVIQSGKYPSPASIFSTIIIPQLTSFKARCPNTQVVLIPSTKDLSHPFITIPQPGFVASPELGLPAGLFHLPGNPARFTVNNVELACLSYDILVAMASTEVSSGDTRPRIPRLADHLLHSAHLFPLYPPADEFCSDFNLPLLNSLSLSHLPQILVTPSNLKAFAHVIGDENVVGINPGRLTLGEQGGSYAVVNVFVDQLDSPTGGLWNPSQCRVDIINV